MDRLLALTAKAEARHFWFRGFRCFVAPWIAKAAGGRQDLRLLDCGCGTGANLALLSSFGHAVGFDLTHSALVSGRQAGRQGLSRASIDAIPFRDACFDVVTSFDVLYALPDATERAALREIYRVLKPGGSVVVTSAALQLLAGGHSSLSGEIRRYTREMMRSRLEAAGFTVERISYTFASTLPLMLMVRLLQRLRFGTKVPPTELEIAVPPSLVNRILSAILVLESQVLNCTDLPFGSSVLCLARRPFSSE